LHWHHCRCCAGIFAIITTNTAVVHCRCQTYLCRASLFWLILVFAAHCRSGMADDKKGCGAAEDENVYHQSAAAEDGTVYPHGSKTKEDDAAYCHGGVAKDNILLNGWICWQRPCLKNQPPSWPLECSDYYSQGGSAWHVGSFSDAQ
jgi:hypothetical protein